MRDSAQWGFGGCAPEKNLSPIHTSNRTTIFGLIKHKESAACVHTTDFLIIGGGIIGSSIAYHIAAKGHKVIVVERGDIASPPVASWASAGGIRRQGRHPAEAPLASEAIARWPGLQEELQ